MEKMLLKIAMLFLAAAGCLFGGQICSAQESGQWRKDWKRFGEAIAPYARAGALELHGDFWEFNRIFSKKVEWRGTLRAFHNNGVAKNLTLEMQPIQIPLPDGSSIEVNKLSISCANEESGCAGWSAELTGKEVIFRTKLINRTRGYQPVVMLHDKGEESQRIEIKTYGAELIKVVSKQERHNNSFNRSANSAAFMRETCVYRRFVAPG